MQNNFEYDIISKIENNGRVLIMDEELKEKLLKILTELPDENSWLDYKVAPYNREDKYEKAEFIKDLCAFLNCTESYGKDKFIILGIADKTKFKRGISQDSMEDDKYYQDLCEFIQPRPHVETGKIKVDDIEYGYILISKDNMERVYSILKDYPDEYIPIEEKANFRKKVYASTAYIRKGSVKYLLNEYDRRKIYEQDKMTKNIQDTEMINYASTQIDDEFKEVLKFCALFGTWNEENEAEKSIISDIIGIEYNSWIKILRKLLSQKSEYISYKNNIWKIQKREELIERYAEDYFAEDIKKFQDATLKIILELNPKFDLEPSKRIMSNIMGRKMTYTKQLKSSVLETFAICKSFSSKFSNCEREIVNSEWFIVRNILEDADWKLYATLNELLPILAEICESEYIKQINSFVSNKDKEVSRLFSEKEEILLSTGYTYGLYWSLELIAWSPNYIIEVFDILGKLKKYDNKAIEVMTRILLPWYPQTMADSTLRIATVKMLLKENGEVGWELLMNLMPHKQMTSFPTYKPKWNNTIIEADRKVTKQELYEEYKEYIYLAIEYSRTNPQRIAKLVDIMDDIPKDLFDLIYDKITSEEVITMSDDDKFIVWSEIENLVARHKKFSETSWALPKEAIESLEKMSKLVKPRKKKIYYKRLFNKDYWDLFDEKSTYDEQERKLLLKQTKAIKDLLKKNIQNVIIFAKTTKDPYRVGIALGELDLKPADEENIIELLDKDEFLLAQGYANKKFYKNKFEWFNSLKLDNISAIGKVRILIELPNNKKVWEKAKELLKDKEDEYWENVDIRCIEDGSEYEYPLKKLLDCNRPVKALELINMALLEKKSFPRNLSAEALNKALKKQENINYMDVYHIKNIIKDLQDNKYNSTELFKIEWAYLPILSNDDEYRPITIEKKLSNNPQVFNDVICLAYKGHNDNTNLQNKDEKLAINAYRLLNTWRLVPGLTEDGVIDKKKLNDWFEKMKELAEKTDRINVSLINFGQVLYYSPKDKDGFWIDRSVAEILNSDNAEEIRKGYSLEAYNSVGVVNVDREGTVWLDLEKKWNERAQNTEMDYFRFARTLREIANQFHENAEYEKKHYKE